MTRAARARAVAALAGAALWWPRPALAHGGLPVPILKHQRAGAYDVSVWATPDIGMAMIYVVYLPRDGAAFVPPTAVRIGLAPVSGRAPEVLYDAHAEPVRVGARFVAHVDFDRGEAWRVRVVTDGPAAVGEVTARVVVSPMEMMGPLGMLFYATPFVLVGGLWASKAFARRRVARRLAAGARTALTSH
jgi:hypothetical protein